MVEAENEPMPSAVRAFDFPSRTRLISGAGSVKRVGELARELGVQHVLLVTDPGIAAAGHAGRVQESLIQAGLRVKLFDKVKENPTTKCVSDCVAVAGAAGIDCLVGLGGGSSMDTAKGCNFILTNGGEMKDYWGVGKATKPMLPFIAIPTTAGTGSEMQCAALNQCNLLGTLLHSYACASLTLDCRGAPPRVFRGIPMTIVGEGSARDLRDRRRRDPAAQCGSRERRGNRRPAREDRGRC